MPSLQVVPQSLWECLLDWLLIPIMHVLMFSMTGTLAESPQQTHRWNNQKLSEAETNPLDITMMVRCSGVQGQYSAPSLLRHMPLTGWRHYVVLAPARETSIGWYVGWVEEGGEGGVSRILLRGQVRMLLGPSSVKFFGVSRSGRQIPLREIAKGRLGRNPEFFRVPML